MDQEMNHPPKINSSPEEHGLLDNASQSEDIAESLTSLLSSFSPSFTPSPHHEDAESRGRVRELEEALQRATGAARDAESRAERAENLLAAKLVDEAKKNAENSELIRANDDLKITLDETQKKLNETKKAKRDLSRTNNGLQEDNIVLVAKMKEGHETKRVLTEEIDSLKQEMAEMRQQKRGLKDENESLRKQLAEMGMFVSNQDSEEKKRKKSAHRGSSKKQNSSSTSVISVKGADPSNMLTMEERYGDATEVVCEGCVWTKVDGEWTVVVGKKDVEPTFDVTFADDETDKMIEEMIRATKERIDAGIDKV